ncbi:hypothetical protein CRE_05527 [Caenorhabditis remanei]|uniref:Transmembrane protein n=1 Tax=Caenorhabditis remanei TaxID=31234 RepID=E3LZS4_CAERE|nr:hypothetical protein CRE_05527 [Caenorhabditis remanei]
MTQINIENDKSDSRERRRRLGRKRRKRRRLCDQIGEDKWIKRVIMRERKERITDCLMVFAPLPIGFIVANWLCCLLVHSANCNGKRTVEGEEDDEEAEAVTSDRSGKITELFSDLM